MELMELGDIFGLKQLIELRLLKITEIEVYSSKGRLNKKIYKRLISELNYINHCIKVEEVNLYN